MSPKRVTTRFGAAVCALASPASPASSAVLAVLAVLTLAFATPAAAQSDRMTFFIVSEGSGDGANLGGLEGADAHCEALAHAQGAGGLGWKAYLSTIDEDGSAAVHARDRIGDGPWHNHAGVLIANDVDELHSDAANLTKETILTEKGEQVNGRGDDPNMHDILTGSNLDGTAFTGNAEYDNCENWTSSGRRLLWWRPSRGRTRVGHHDRVGGGRNPTSWNSAHMSRGCSQRDLRGTGGDGLFYCFAPAGAAVQPSRDPTSADLPSLMIEELTWTEVQAALDGGVTTVILPTAGTEQNGPHMVTGKHRYIVEEASKRIARELGNALVAPAVTYVPEGEVDPPSGHMRYAGTITLPNEHFMKLLEYAARSFRAHGFTEIVFIGDSGGNQRGMEAVVATLNEEWQGDEARVHFVGDYYSANGFREWLMEQGETEETIGRHAGISDTSILLYVAAQHIRQDQLAPGGGFEGSGVSGDPTRASAEYGRVGMEMRVAAAVRQIRALIGGR